MGRLLFIVGIFTLAISCKKNKVMYVEESTTRSSEEKQLDSLAYELCTIYGFDQGVRDWSVYGEIDVRTIKKIDSLNFVKLVGIIEKFGYPSRRIFGENFKINHECVIMGSASVMLHNPQRVVNDEYVFNLFLNEVNKGNLHRTFFADILDKYYWSKSKGERVMYGSQFGVPCIATKEETNRLRQEIGLEPLNDDEFKECD